MQALTPAQYAVVLCSGLFVGRLFDRGLWPWLAVSGTLAVGASMLALSFATQLYQIILAYGLLCPVGLGALYVPSVACLAQFWERRRVRASSRGAADRLRCSSSASARPEQASGPSRGALA